MKLLTGCQLVGYNPRKDKSITLRFETGEKTPEDVMNIHSMLDTFGYLLFKGEEQLTKTEIEEIENLDTELYDNPKTQSQRIRNTIMVLHKLSNNDLSKSDYYKRWTEWFLDKLKKEIEKLTI
jgi:hypothetical protein